MIRDNLPPADGTLSRNSSSASRKNRILSRSKLIRLVAVACVLVLIAVVGVVWLQRDNSSKDASKTGDDSKAVDGKTGAIENAQNHSMLGDYENAARILDDQVAKTDSSDKEALSDLYEQKALVYYNNSQFDKALASAKQAEDTKPTAATAGLVADSSHKIGDDKTALIFYHKQLDRLKEDTTLGPTDMSTKDVIQKIEQLGGSA